MKKLRFILAVLLIMALMLSAAAGCSNEKEETDATTSTSETITGDNDDLSGQSDQIVFDYSEGIDANGFWSGIKALDFVDLCDYKQIEISSDIHAITDEVVQTEIDSLLNSAATDEKITDRAVKDGDTVNIDFVGSVDGVEFEGGSTDGAGTEVTIGVTTYIDDFLEQLIGHEPGETFDVEVTFPEDYGVETLNGKDAVFVTTINYIVEPKIPELDDAFVTDNFYESHNWNNVKDLTEGIRSDMQKSAISIYLQTYVIENCIVETVPEDIIRYQENSMISYYQDYANAYSVGLDDFLTTYMGAASREDFLSQNLSANTESAKFYLIIQAIAEDAGIEVSDEDAKALFVADYMSEEDYEEFVSVSGMPYVKLIALNETVMRYLENEAVLA